MRKCARLKCEGYAEDNGVYCHTHKYTLGQTRRSGLHPVAIVAGLLMVLLVLALFSKTVFAATYYRDRVVPVANSVCMVNFLGSDINANMIQGVGYVEQNVLVGDYKTESYGPLWLGTKNVSTYRAVHYLRVTLANARYYEKELPTVEAVEQAKVAFLKQIEEKCK